MKLSAHQRAALAAFLLKNFSVWVRTKDDAAEMNVIAGAFGLAQLFGLGVPTSDEFLNRFWTTLGPVVYAPRGAGALADHLRPLCHEITHCVGFWREGLGFVSRYATRKGRAELEAEAERAAIEVWWLLTGELPASREALDVTRHGYAMDHGAGDHDDHADLTRDLLETAVTSVRAGVLSTDVGLAVAGWLVQRAPEAMVGRFVTAPGAAS